MTGLRTVAEAVEAAGPRPDVGSSSTDKKNYAERLSRHLATAVANRLRSDFPGVTPNQDGSSQEQRTRSAKGFKKLDVGYSTPELGLGLGVSIKTVTLPDPKTGRFTKNYSRIDNELRAEATDYHVRQPYSVLCAVLFLPREAALDSRSERGGEDSISSFAAAVRYFRPRGGRRGPDETADRFELVCIGLYDQHGKVEPRFFDVECPPPRAREPSHDESCDFEGLLAAIHHAYTERNDPPFTFID